METSSISPEIPTQSSEVPANKPTVSDIISDSFAAFDHRGKIVEPFDNESKRDAEFQEKLSAMLLELMLDFHAWSSARPTLENDRTADILEKDINALIETEKEQETTRQRLGEFIQRIKSALAALTGLAT